VLPVVTPTGRCREGLPAAMSGRSSITTARSAVPAPPEGGRPRC